jgi:hypothetical protein
MGFYDHEISIAVESLSRHACHGEPDRIVDVLVTLLWSLGEPLIGQLFFAVKSTEPSQIVGRLRIIGLACAAFSAC